eukprot:457840-Hanusia_phi.AAC.1
MPDSQSEPGPGCASRQQFPAREKKIRNKAAGPLITLPPSVVHFPSRLCTESTLLSRLCYEHVTVTCTAQVCILSPGQQQSAAMICCNDLKIFGNWQSRCEDSDNDRHEAEDQKDQT